MAIILTLKPMMMMMMMMMMTGFQVAINVMILMMSAIPAEITIGVHTVNMISTMMEIV